MKKILIIEDNADIRDNIAELLTLHDFTVQEAANGLEGFEFAKQYIPDLIICDMMMPVTDGEVFFNLAKSEPTLKHTPLIFFSAGSMHADAKKRLESSRTSYLQKPFTEEDLLDVINKALARDTTMIASAPTPV
jgi:CheY-like chemotaxis protein